MKKWIILSLLILLIVPVSASALTWATDPSGVVLSWTPNPETDVLGYKVYQASTSDGMYSVLHTDWITGTSFTDTTTVEGESVWYKLVCGDVCGNISGFSLPSDEVVWDITKPTPVAGFTGQVNVCSGEVLLTWLPHDDLFFKTFHLSRSLAPEGPFEEVYTGTKLLWSEVRETGTVYYRIVPEDDACWLGDPVILAMDVIADTDAPSPPVW